MSFVNLEPGELLLTTGEEVLWRLVHPNHMDGDFPSGEAFTDKSRQVSVVRSTMRTAGETYDFHRQSHDCAGAWGVTVAEAEEVECRAVDDSAYDPTATPGHAYVDYRHLALEKRKRARMRTELSAAAKERGRFHP